MKNEYGADQSLSDMAKERDRWIAVLGEKHEPKRPVKKSFWSFLFRSK